jgi:hypothetical protein
VWAPLESGVMDTDRALDLLRERLTELGELPPEYGTPEFREWHQKTERTLKRIFGPDHDFVGQFRDISFLSRSMSDDPSAERRAFGSGRTGAVALLKGAIYELEVLFEPTQFASAASVDLELWEHVRRLVESEQWAQVASQTAIFVESKSRQWAGLPGSKFGKDLMVAVLKPGAGLFPLGRTPGEHEGWLALGIGITLAVGNADRHRIQQRDDAKRYAMGVLGAGSLLLTQLRHQHANSFQT